jgi:hypothetical protein
MANKPGPFAAGLRGGFRSTISDGERSQIIAALREGRKPIDIAREVGRSENAVRSIAREAGLISPRSRYTPVDKRRRKLSVILPESVAALLERAAARRGAGFEILAARILIGVVARGSIDKPSTLDHACDLADDYEHRKAREAATAAQAVEV